MLLLFIGYRERVLGVAVVRWLEGVDCVGERVFRYFGGIYTPEQFPPLAH